MGARHDTHLCGASNGALEQGNPFFAFPKPKNPDDVYTPYPVLAIDPTDHLAIAIQAQNKHLSQRGWTGRARELYG